MKIYIPPHRLIILGLVLQFDREEERLFSPHERFAINQERAKIMANDYSYQQQDYLNRRIDDALCKIEATRWSPLAEIRFG